MQFYRVQRNNVEHQIFLYIAHSDQMLGWPQSLALYYLVETFGADLGMALMSSIMRSVSKSGIRSSLGESKTTELVSA